MSKLKCALSASALLLLLACAASAQTTNLLQNPDATEDSQHWRAFKDAKVEGDGGERAFVLRGGGYFVQDVSVPKGSAGHYAVLTGSGRNAPCLHGYMMNAGDPSGGVIYAYLGGQKMCGAGASPSEWIRLWGIFRVPEGTERLRFFLQQGAARVDAQDGAATRFRGLGLYVFPTEVEARSFVGAEAASIHVRRAKGDGATACEIWRARPAPVELYGLRLGMSLEEVASLFPGFEENADTRRALARANSDRGVGEASFFISTAPYETRAKADGVTRVWVKMLDGKVYSIYLDYAGATWKTVDDFIASRADEWHLPPADTWYVVQDISGKYIICDDTELRFYDAPTNSRNNNYVRLTDLAAEKALARRKEEKNRPAR